MLGDVIPTITFTTEGGLNKSALRHANERLILNTLRLLPGASRADVARITGLSSSSVTFIVDRLIRRKVLVHEPVQDHSHVGRRPIALRLRADGMLALGVRVSLSGAGVVLSDLTGRFVRRKGVQWHPSHDVFLGRVHQSIRTIVEGVSPEKLLGAGVALPGFIECATGKIIAAENYGWIGIEAGQPLKKGLPFPFYFENAARLAALGEMWFTSDNSRLLRNFVFVSMRAGLGTGVMMDGHIFHGAFSVASEFGHMVIYPDGIKCSCGNRGCWEQYASDLALCRRYLEKSGSEATAETIVEKARRGDSTAWEVLQETAKDVALGFINLIVGLNPEAVIVDDYLADAWDLIEKTIWGVLRDRVPEYHLAGMRIFPSRHAEDGVLFGACALVFAKFFTSFDNKSSEVRSRSAST